MILILSTIISQCAVGQVTCLRCLQDENCSYCPDSMMCEPSNETHCPNPLFKKNKACVEALGRDAKSSYRYGIGFSVLIISIIIDILIRVYEKRHNNQNYRAL